MRGTRAAGPCRTRRTSEAGCPYRSIDGDFFDLAGGGIALEVAEAVLTGDDDVVGHAEEEAVFNDAGAGAEFGGEFFGIGEGSEGAVVNDVALVGEEWCAVRLAAENGVAAELLKEELLGFRAKRDDFDRQGVQGAELR